MSTVLAADIGTTSLKAALIDESGSVLAESRVEFSQSAEKRKAALEYKPALKAAAGSIATKPGLARPDALCISGNGPTVVGEDGNTLLWNEPLPPLPCEVKASKSLFIPSLWAFKTEFAKSWEMSGAVFGGPEFLIHELTGAAVAILPEERFKSAYWDSGALNAARFTSSDKSKLPPFVQPGAMAGKLTQEAAGFLGPDFLAAGTPVYTGAPDFVSALVGTATLESGRLCDRAGSSEGLNLCTPFPLYGDEIRTLPSAAGGLWNASFLLQDTGLSFSKFRRRLEEETGARIQYGELADALLSDNARSAPWLPARKLEEGKEILLRIANELKRGLETLRLASEKAGLGFPEEMSVAGGQAKNRNWNIFKSRFLGIRIRVPECADAELTGDAVFAFKGMGLFHSLEEAAEKLCRTAETFSPQENNKQK